MKLWQDLISVTTTTALVSIATFSYTNERLFVFFSPGGLRRRSFCAEDRTGPTLKNGIYSWRKARAAMGQIFKMSCGIVVRRIGSNSEKRNSEWCTFLQKGAVAHSSLIHTHIIYLSMSYLSQFAADDDADLVLVMMMVMVVTVMTTTRTTIVNIMLMIQIWFRIVIPCWTCLSPQSQDWWKFMLSKGLLGTQQMENKAKAEGCNEESIDT